MRKTALFGLVMLLLAVGCQGAGGNSSLEARVAELERRVEALEKGSEEAHVDPLRRDGP